MRGTHSLEAVDIRSGQDTESKQASKGTTEEVRGWSGQDTERNHLAGSVMAKRLAAGPHAFFCSAFFFLFRFIVPAIATGHATSES